MLGIPEPKIRWNQYLGWFPWEFQSLHQTESCQGWKMTVWMSPYGLESSEMRSSGSFEPIRGWTESSITNGGEIEMLGVHTRVRNHDRNRARFAWQDLCRDYEPCSIRTQKTWRNHIIISVWWFFMTRTRAQWEHSRWQLGPWRSLWAIIYGSFGVIWDGQGSAEWCFSYLLTVSAIDEIRPIPSWTNIRNHKIFVILMWG